jgi:hypothetical protein
MARGRSAVLVRALHVILVPIVANWYSWLTHDKTHELFSYPWSVRKQRKPGLASLRRVEQHRSMLSAPQSPERGLSRTTLLVVRSGERIIGVGCVQVKGSLRQRVGLKPHVSPPVDQSLKTEVEEGYSTVNRRNCDNASVVNCDNASVIRTILLRGESPVSGVECRTVLQWSRKCVIFFCVFSVKSVCTLVSNITMGRFSDTRRFGEGADRSAHFT